MRTPFFSFTRHGSGNNIIAYQPPYTFQQLVAFDATWQMRFRVLTGQNSNGSYTRGIISGFDDEFLEVFGWDNGIPSVGVPLYLYRISPRVPIIVNTETVINISELLLEETISIVKQIESEEKYDLRVSRASFSLDVSESLNDFMDTYWRSPGEINDEYLIGVEIENQFWGYCNFENINFDEINQTYHLDAYDWVKWLQLNIWTQPIPTLDLVSMNLEYFLTLVCNVINAFGASLLIDVGSNPLNFNRRHPVAPGFHPPLGYDYIGGDNALPNGTGDYYALEQSLTINDFIIECMKNYGAVMFFDKSRNLVFTRRTKINTVGYLSDNILLEVNLNRSYENNKYKGLLINFWGSTSWGSSEGWALVWEKNGAMEVDIVNANLRNIPEGFSYLDLRQQLPNNSFTYRCFPTRTKEERYEDYKELLRASKMYELNLDGVDFELFDKLIKDDQEYIIKYLNENLIEETSEARVYRSLA